MNRRALKRLDSELSEFFDAMLDGIGRRERRAAIEGYIAGLLLDGERKSIEPMAGRLVDDEGEIQAMRQRLQECVSVSTWSDGHMYRRLAQKLDRELPGVEAMVIDDTGFPKKASTPAPPHAPSGMRRPVSWRVLMRATGTCAAPASRPRASRPVLSRLRSRMVGRWSLAKPTAARCSRVALWRC